MNSEQRRLFRRIRKAAHPHGSSGIGHCRADDVKKILNMPQWQESKYQKLLGPNIWLRNYEAVKKIVARPEWQQQ